MADTLDGEMIDTTAVIVRVWQLKEDYSIQVEHKLDTLETYFQVYNPAMKYSFTGSYLGNLGTSFKSNDFFNRGPDVPFLFLIPFKPYLYLPSNNTYYNVRSPFSILEYSTTGQNKEKREQLVRAFHTQNINPFFNAGIDLKLTSSEGHYLDQKSKTSRFRFFSSYKKGDYSVHGSLGFNSFTLNENGGLQDDNLFIQTNQEAKTYPVNLGGASSQTRNLGVQISQRYRFGSEKEIPDTTSATGFTRLRERTAKTGSLLHTVEFSRNRRQYKDGLTGSSSFYRNFYIDSISSFDSTFARSLTNTIHIILDENPNRKNDFGARAFISHEWVTYEHNKQADTNISSTNDTVIENVSSRQYNNIYVGASLVHTVGTGWNWIFTGKLYLTGYKAGDILLYGKIDKFIHAKKGESSISLSGSLALTEPDYFLQHYASNHFKWENDFKKTKEIWLSLGIENEPTRLELGGNISTVSDYVYFGTDTLPHQRSGIISVFSADVNKHFRLGPFNSIHTLLWQMTTDNDVIRLPDLSYYTSNFFGFTLVKNVLTAEIGFDLMYYTKYQGLAYMPSYGMFFNQDERKIGNYPYLDLFITAKLKRTRFYFKMDHINAGWLSKDYFHTLHYPMPARAFKFGLSWNFYD